MIIEEERKERASPARIGCLCL